MSDPRPEILILAEKNIDNGKLEKALEIVTNFEKNSNITPKEQLWALLLRGFVHNYKLQMKETVEVGEQAYQLSRELEMVSESIEALILKTSILFLGKAGESLEIITKIEELLKNLSKLTNFNISRLNFLSLTAKSWCYLYLGDYNTALELALKILKSSEMNELKLQHSYHLFLLCLIYTFRGENNRALEHGTKSLSLLEELGTQVGIASSLWAIGNVYYYKGNLNKALEIYERSLSIGEISDFTKVNSLTTLGAICRVKGELNKALEYINEAIEIADEAIHYAMITTNLMSLGEIYRRKGEIEQAKSYFNRSLKHGGKLGDSGILLYLPLFFLVLLYLDTNTPHQAQQYLERLKKLSDQDDSKIITQGYRLAKAAVLKSSGRRRNSVEAEEAELFLREIIEDDIVYNNFHVILINPIESFLVCYVIKGQSYPALKKLNRFTETIKENSEIWQALNKSAKTSEMLELNKPLALKKIINEIFT